MAKLPQNDNRKYSSLGNSLIHGMDSQFIKGTLEKHGVDVKELDVFDDSFSNRVKLKMDAFMKYKEIANTEIAMIKSTGARCFNMYHEMIHLKFQIAEREKKIVEEGRDPLIDVHLQKAYRRYFEIVKWLEERDYDREKTERIHELKKEEKSDDDILFVRET